jgi:hypothetical protein
MALRNMFAPQAYKRGGEVIDGVAHFRGGGENDVAEEPGIATKLGSAAYDVATLPYQFMSGWFGGKPMSMTPAYDEFVRRKRGETGEAPTSPAQIVGATTKDVLTSPVRGVQQIGNIIDPKEVPPVQSFTPTRDIYQQAAPPSAAAAAEDRLRAAGLANLTPDIVASMEDKDRRDVMRPGGMYNVGETPPVPPPNPKDESIQTNLEAIKARREASDKQREQNKWMGIMAAGLGMMASKNPHAMGGIGEGGLQGLQTYAGLEKARREEETNLRHEDYQKQQLDLQKQQMGQQLDIAKMQLAKDPDNVRLIKQIGGGDFNKGYEIYKREEAVKSAKSIMDAPLGTPGVTDADREWAVRTIRSATSSRTGSSGWSGQLVSPAPSGTR